MLMQYVHSLLIEQNLPLDVVSLTPGVKVYARRQHQWALPAPFHPPPPQQPPCPSPAPQSLNSLQENTSSAPGDRRKGRKCMSQM